MIFCTVTVQILLLGRFRLVNGGVRRFADFEFLENDIRFHTEALSGFDLSLMHRIAQGNLKSSSLRILIKTIEQHYVKTLV